MSVSLCPKTKQQRAVAIDQLLGREREREGECCWPSVDDRRDGGQLSTDSSQRSSAAVAVVFQKRKNIAKDRKVIPDPIDDRKFQE